MVGSLPLLQRWTHPIVHSEVTLSLGFSSLCLSVLGILAQGHFSLLSGFPLASVGLHCVRLEALSTQPSFPPPSPPLSPLPGVRPMCRRLVAHAVSSCLLFPGISPVNLLTV